MLTIDGSQGEGGGQILRSALALSMVTGMPFRIERIRAGRRKPGLMRQHLTAVRAAQEVCGATVEGEHVGATTLEFEPGAVHGGTYHFAVGTAGSATLVLQTVLPALVLAKEPSTLMLEGGTHNPFAPPFDFLDRVFVPLLNRMIPASRSGRPGVSLALERSGFYPAGGGRFTVHVEPTGDGGLQGLELLERGEVTGRCARALVANLPGDIGERELAVVGSKLGWSADELHAERRDDAAGPGNVVMIEVQSEHVAELCTGFGERSRSAASVATQAVEQIRRYLAADVPVGAHLADQLLLPLALAGHGTFRTLHPSRHTQTHIELIGQFLDVPVTMEQESRDRWVITVGK